MKKIKAYNEELGIWQDISAGEQGPQGEPGKDGTMSFEDLTEEQKASLKGDKGDKGDNGEPGSPGVWVGNTAPTDEFNVWIAPAGEGSEGLVTAEQLNNYYTKTEVDNAIDTIELTPGPQGEKGEPGADGKTPVKGVDYYTEADKTEMVNLVLAAIPGAEEVNY